ncbi:uncharacterized protein LOC130630240 [Hydractinia symbiolongicarpus]|uniref:uncharacterized protein LOC130630240 n=1 Tax=Hydractinia symbiolongicarpus TaxID=13093 RepID=UPI00254D709C|nr:uncharacterized protein LOC130630240 [Hydractinia symbiolongicarpus]
MENQIGQQQNDATLLVSSSPIRILDAGNARKIFIMGIVQIVAAVLMLGFGISILATLRLKDSFNINGTSIWVPLWILVTGILGVCIGYKPHSRGLIGTHNVFVIVSAILAFGLICVSGVALRLYTTCKMEYYNYPNWDNDGKRIIIYSASWRNKICKDHKDYGVAVYSILLVLSLVEIAISIASTIFSFQLFNCCTGGCETRHTVYPGSQQVYQYTGYPPPQLSMQPCYQSMIPLQNIQSMQLLQQQLPQVVTSVTGQQFMCYSIYVPVNQGMVAPQTQQTSLTDPLPQPTVPM